MIEDERPATTSDSPDSEQTPKQVVDEPGQQDTSLDPVDLISEETVAAISDAQSAPEMPASVGATSETDKVVSSEEDQVPASETHEVLSSERSEESDQELIAASEPAEPDESSPADGEAEEEPEDDDEEPEDDEPEEEPEDEAEEPEEELQAEVEPEEELQAEVEPEEELQAEVEPEEEPVPPVTEPAVMEETQDDEPKDNDGEAEESEEELEPVPDNKNWYVVKVQSGREESIKDAIERRVRIEGLELYFDQILIPTEKETVMVKGKRIVRDRKKFPGYIMAKVEFNDEILYLFRETTGVGDFVGGGPNVKPLPMPQKEVDLMLGPDKDKKPGEKAKLQLDFSVGDRVKIKDGVFSGLEGEVKDMLELKEQVRVEVEVLGRRVPVELEYWQVEAI